MRNAQRFENAVSFLLHLVLPVVQMLGSFPGNLVSKSEFHRPINSQCGEMHIVFIVEHDLLPVLLRLFMVHASISSFADNFVKSFAIVGDYAEERRTPRSRASKNKQLGTVSKLSTSMLMWLLLPSLLAGAGQRCP